MILDTNRRVPTSMVCLDDKLNGESCRAYLHNCTSGSPPGAVLCRKVRPQLASQLADFGEESVVADGRLDQVHIDISGQRLCQLKGLGREIEPVRVP